jgi:hypothetical protein
MFSEGENIMEEATSATYEMDNDFGNILDLCKERLLKETNIAESAITVVLNIVYSELENHTDDMYLKK